MYWQDMKNAFTVEKLRSKLPNVGDSLIKAPVMGKILGICSREPRRCKVTYVNREHLWYEVQFESGYREVYKLPETVSTPEAGKPRRVRCVETGIVYDTMMAAGQAVGCTASVIRDACKNRNRRARNLHWEYVR